MVTVKRADLSEAVRHEVGLRRRDDGKIVDTLIEAIRERLSAGETENFRLRDKRARPGRNPKSGEAAQIAARRVVVFRPSQNPRKRINEGMSAGRKDAHEAFRSDIAMMVKMLHLTLPAFQQAQQRQREERFKKVLVA